MHDARLGNAPKILQAMMAIRGVYERHVSETVAHPYNPINTPPNSPPG
jgi:hypothetical protein